MSKRKPKSGKETKQTPKKKVVVTTEKKAPRASTRTARSSRAASRMPSEDMLFDRSNYILMGVGLLVIVFGFLLMAGGAMPDPNTWDENIIYGTRRITIAPLVVLIGLGIEIYAIFK